MEKEVSTGIYKLQIGHAVYVGGSVNIKNRIKTHISALKHGNHKNKTLQREYDDGWPWNYSILEKCKAEDMDAREQYWITKLKASSFIVNRTSGGRSGYRHSEETLKTLSEKMKGRKRAKMNQNKLEKIKRSLGL